MKILLRHAIGQVVAEVRFKYHQISIPKDVAADGERTLSRPGFVSSTNYGRMGHTAEENIMLQRPEILQWRWWLHHWLRSPVASSNGCSFQNYSANKISDNWEIDQLTTKEQSWWLLWIEQWTAWKDSMMDKYDKRPKWYTPPRDSERGTEEIPIRTDSPVMTMIDQRTCKCRKFRFQSLLPESESSGPLLPTRANGKDSKATFATSLRPISTN